MTTNIQEQQIWPSYIDSREQKSIEVTQDLLIERDGKQYAGTHLILDMWQAQHLDDLDLIEQTLRHCVEIAGATLLHIHLHHFTPNGGVSGVAVLAESHISIHTWPERDYAALDIFMCGDTMPEKCIDVLQLAFETSTVNTTTLLRGEVPVKQQGS
ncbi:MAG: adenosylmethionine decarboxylase [Thiotrichaceae bacterium]|nr:adenosylmethionine decarboxylase [Thiotrichaceae bacterium]